MATQNLTVTPTPVKLADAGADFFLSLPILPSWKRPVVVEWATTNTPGTPPIAGKWHPLKSWDGDRLNREVANTSLEIWVRCYRKPVTVIVEQ
jgi:hypothetical protein